MKKYKVSKSFYDELWQWRINREIKLYVLTYEDFIELPKKILRWLLADDINYEWGLEEEQYNRYKAINSWLRGEVIFEVEKPKKWVVRSKYSTERGNHIYVYVTPTGLQDATYSKSLATKFNTKEEAQSWANSHQEVIEVNK